jgi:hypothetical protein
MRVIAPAADRMQGLDRDGGHGELRCAPVFLLDQRALATASEAQRAIALPRESATCVLITSHPRRSGHHIRSVL